MKKSLPFVVAVLLLSACNQNDLLSEVRCGRVCIVENTGEISLIPESYASGQCSSGILTCTDSGEVCEGFVAASPEVCDTLDNDCDGHVDEGLGHTVGDQCSIGENGDILAPEEGLTGVCTNGVLACNDSGGISCVGVVKPSPELCDTLDNNCDGFVDNSPSDVPPEVCPAIECLPQEPVCTNGAWECPSEVALGNEICDGLDNDCDGLIDEDEPHDPLFDDGIFVYDGDISETANFPCRPGTRICQDGVEAIIGMVTPEAEVCDLIDNDCNGLVDDNPVDSYVIPYSGPPETEGVGICAPAEQICIDGVTYQSAEVLPSPEDCHDNLDNDCDGEVNEETTEVISQSFVLVLDISGSMNQYLEPMMDALCAWADSAILNGSLFNIVLVGNDDDDDTTADTPPLSLTNGFVFPSQVCSALFGPTGYQEHETNGDEYQLWGILTAQEHDWPHGLSRNVIVFSDEGLQSPHYGSSWGYSGAADIRLREDCVQKGYRLITYSQSSFSW